MRLPPLAALKWCLTLAGIGCVLLVLYVIHVTARDEDKDDRPTAEAKRTGKAGVVALEDDEAERFGLETQSARAVAWRERVTVFGRVVPNPQATAEIRTPFAGVLRGAPGAWPALGQRVHGGRTLGWVDIRVGPEVRLDLENKLAEARVRQRGAAEEVRLQQGRADSLRQVTTQQILARGELDAALIQLAQAKNQLATATAAAELWEKALHEVERHKDDGGSRWSQPLVAPADGEITEVVGRPGSSVEAGTLVLTVVNFRRPLVRLDLPPEVLAQGGPPPEVELQVPGVGGYTPSLKAHRAGPAPRVEAASQFVSYWYTAELPASSALWRPGMQVTAEVQPTGAAAQAAVLVPAEAVLYHEGRSLVYVRSGPEQYQRRDVRLLGRLDGQWVLAARQADAPGGVTAGEPVVYRAAQVLLSKEFLVVAADDD